jgi:hypothetical protein
MGLFFSKLDFFSQISRAAADQAERKADKKPRSKAEGGRTWKLRSTAGRSITTGMPLARKCSAGPMPDRSTVAASYYNKIRTHRSLDKDAPAFRSVQRVGNITSYTILGGLHHHHHVRV